MAVLTLLAFLVTEISAQSCRITGRVAVPELQGKNISVVNMNTGKTLATTKIADSAYTLEIQVTEAFAGMLRTAPQNSNPNSYYYLRMVGEPGDIYADLVTDSLSGTPLNGILYRFSRHCNNEVRAISALYTKVSQMASVTAREQKLKEAEARLNSLLSYVKNAYETNKTNPVGALAFENYLEYDEEASYEMVMEMLDGSAPVVTTYQPVVRKLAALERVSHTATGKPYIDLDLTDYKTGKPVKLSNVIDGKVALIDFWASWCGPCRREIPNIKKIHEQYGSKDFVVVSLNVWDKPDAQAKAIKDMGMKWTQLTDATRNATDTYGVDGIPQILLIGKDGKIIARDLRGEEIEEAVKKALEN